MSRGSPQRTEARKEEILQACAALYETKGFKEITIKDIGGATTLTRTGIYLYPARKLDEAVRFFKEHDAEIGQVATGSVRSFGCTRGVPYYGREATEKELEAARERIEKRNKYREGLRIVELESREK